jgi:nitroreductase
MRIDELLGLMKERRSVRKFSSEAVSDGEIRCLLEAACSAPSNSNRQAWKFLVIKHEGVKSKLADAVAQKAAAIRSGIANPELAQAFDAFTGYLTFFRDAPVVIIALSKRTPSFLDKLLHQADGGNMGSAELMSVSMAIQNLQLAAHALGLGCCCMTGPCMAADEVASILDIRAPFELAAVVPVGRYDEPPQAPARKDIMLVSEIIE